MAAVTTDSRHRPGASHDTPRRRRRCRPSRSPGVSPATYRRRRLAAAVLAVGAGGRDGAGGRRARGLTPRSPRAPPDRRPPTTSSWSSPATRCGRSPHALAPGRGPPPGGRRAERGPRRCAPLDRPARPSLRWAGLEPRPAGHELTGASTVTRCVAPTARRTTTRSSTPARRTTAARSGADAECLACGRRYTTHERVVELPLMVGSAPGSRSRSSAAKLAAGIERAVAGQRRRRRGRRGDRERDRGGGSGGGPRGHERAARARGARAAPGARSGLVPAVRVRLQGVRGRRRLRARGRRAPARPPHPSAPLGRRSRSRARN